MTTDILKLCAQFILDIHVIYRITKCQFKLTEQQNSSCCCCYFTGVFGRLVENYNTISFSRFLAIVGKLNVSILSHIPQSQAA